MALSGFQRTSDETCGPCRCDTFPCLSIHLDAGDNRTMAQVKITIAITSVIAQELEEICKSESRSRSDVMREAFQCYMLSRLLMKQ
jgi:hypothetical protein